MCRERQPCSGSSPWEQQQCPVDGTDPSNVAARGSDAADGEADAAGRLGDEGTLLQGVVDALDAVVLHAQQEAAGGNKWFQQVKIGRKSVSFHQAVKTRANTGPLVCPTGVNKGQNRKHQQQYLCC